MNDQQENFEMQVQNVAKTFPYPPTPDIASTVRQSLRRKTHSAMLWLARMAAVLMIVFIIMMLVPPIRAAVLEMIGAITVYPYEKPTPTLPGGTPTPLTSVLDLPGETSLDEALTQVRFTVIQPDYRAPDRVFLFGETPILVFVWLDENGQVAFSLHCMRSNSFGGKYYPWEPERFSIKGRTALWFENPHLLEMFEPSEISRYIEGNVLVWDYRGITYRLEGHLTKEEAVRIAESIIEEE